MPVDGAAGEMARAGREKARVMHENEGTPCRPPRMKRAGLQMSPPQMPGISIDSMMSVPGKLPI
jgi:hypothetical protein